MLALLHGSIPACCFDRGRSSMLRHAASLAQVSFALHSLQTSEKNQYDEPIRLGTRDAKLGCFELAPKKSLSPALDLKRKPLKS